jgi:PAS domain-containing protein
MGGSAPSPTHRAEPQRYQQLYAMLLDAIPSSVVLIDQDLRIASANRNFLEKNRRTLPDTIGHRLDEVFPAIIIDQMDFPGRIRQVFEKNFPVKGERMTYRAPGWACPSAIPSSSSTSAPSPWRAVQAKAAPSP